MRKPKQDYQHKSQLKENGFVISNARMRDRQAEKTIEQLKQSIGSIEKMIEKSQLILRSTRPLQPRETRSDSLELRLNFNSSKSKNKDHPNRYDSKEQLNQLSTTAITRNTSKPTTPIAKEFNSFRQKMSKLPYLPPKTKPQKPYLFIDTEILDGSEDDKRGGRQNIFIYDSKSPVSTVNHHKQFFEQSFADSLENPFNYGRRIRTEALNDSNQRSFLQESLERNSIERSSEANEKQIHVKKVVLKRKPKNNNLNLNHMKTMAELEQSMKKPKRQFIFQMERSPQKIKQGKYSYSTKTKPYLSQNLLMAKRKEKNNERVEPRAALYQTNPLTEECMKFNKQNSGSQIDEFYKKVKKFGFVERYLTYSQIGCIYEFLKKSSIPQHKWPLYVVDKVYEKMQGLSRVKI